MGLERRVGNSISKTYQKLLIAAKTYFLLITLFVQSKLQILDRSKQVNKDGTFRFKLPPQLEVRLKRESERSGFSIAEILRRSADEYLDRKEEKARKDADS